MIGIANAGRVVSCRDQCIRCAARGAEDLFHFTGGKDIAAAVAALVNISGVGVRAIRITDSVCRADWTVVSGRAFARTFVRCRPRGTKEACLDLEARICRVGTGNPRRAVIARGARARAQRLGGDRQSPVSSRRTVRAIRSIVSIRVVRFVSKFPGWAFFADVGAPFY